MDKILGTQLEKLCYENIRKVVDLTYFDGPLLSLFRDFEGQNFIFHWCDSDELCNRWLVFQISDEQFQDYIKQKLSLSKLILAPMSGEIVVVDIDGQGNHRAILSIQPENLPGDYLPRVDTFFDPLMSIFYEQEICSESFAILFDEIRLLREAKLKPILSHPQDLRPWLSLSQEKIWFESKDSTRAHDTKLPLAIPPSRPFGKPQLLKQ